MRGDNVLLLRVRDPFSGTTFWLPPGGGREGSEGEEDCVRREVHEETGLAVEVGLLLWEQTLTGDVMYQRTKTYLCRLVDGTASPGREPEFQPEEHHIIERVEWFALDRPETWGPEITDDALTSGFLARLRAELYPS